MGEEELMHLKINLATFTATVTEWMESTKLYRRELCAKNDLIRLELKDYKVEVKSDLSDIKEKFNNLPCKERGEMYKGNKIMFALYGVAIGFITTLLAVHLGWK